MRRTLIVAVVVIGSVAFATRRHHVTPETKAELALAIVNDVAATDGRDIEWYMHGEASHAYLWQHGRAETWGDRTSVSVRTEQWRLELAISKVSAIRCLIRGSEHGFPGHGFIAFHPADGNGFYSLFDIGFDQNNIDVLEHLCAKHGIPIER